MVATPFIAKRSHDEKGKSKLFTERLTKLMKEWVVDMVFLGNCREIFHC